MYTLVVAALLFFAVTPGILVKLYVKNVYVTAVIHAVVFVILFSLLQSVSEGFISVPPVCPYGKTFYRSIAKCAVPTYVEQTDPIVRPDGSRWCPGNKTYYDKLNKCAIYELGNRSEPMCNPGFSFSFTNNKCNTPDSDPNGNPGRNPIEPSCPRGQLFDPGACSCSMSDPSCPPMYTLADFNSGSQNFGCWCLPDKQIPPNIPI
jgi:hypothetical protein